MGCSPFLVDQGSSIVIEIGGLTKLFILNVRSGNEGFSSGFCLGEVQRFRGGIWCGREGI
jgi:hypothetical protein